MPSGSSDHHSTGSSQHVTSLTALNHTLSTSTPKRPRAAAFDAARSGSWHYYSPVANGRSKAAISSRNSRSQSRDSMRAVSPTGNANRPVFDAANPSTWSRATRVLYETSEPRTTSQTMPENRASAGRPANDMLPQSLQDWNVYLASAGGSQAERDEIMSDVLRTLRHVDDRVAAASYRQRQRTVGPDSSISHTGLPHAVTSVLDDPDFGDTSTYWNTLYGASSTGLIMQSASRRNPRATTSIRPVLPQQPTHLNYEGIRPQWDTVRRRPSTASVNSHASGNTLPEYSASAVDGPLILPDYRSRASSEIQA